MGIKTHQYHCADKIENTKTIAKQNCRCKMRERETRRINQFAVLEGGAFCCSGTFVVVVEIKIT